MSTLKNYKPQDRDIWRGRIDDPDDMDSFRWHQWVEFIDLEKPPAPADGAAGICFLGFCCDKGVEKNQGRAGASRAPEFIRKEMANLPLRFDRNTKLYDAGNLYCGGEGLESSQQELALAVEKIISLNLFPIVLGGGHEIAFGHYNGLSRSVAGEEIGIINFDAHFDLRPYAGGPNSGSMFLQIADDCRRDNRRFSYFCLGVQTYANTISLFNTAEALKTEYIPAKDINDAAVPGIIERLDGFVGNHPHIYLTLCADVISSAYAPGVSAPQPFGLHPETLLKLIKPILGSGKVRGFDIAEVSPRFDEDNRTAKLAAVIVFATINVLAELP